MTRLARSITFFVVFAAIALAASPAQAIPLTFDVNWSGASFGNNAKASGFIVLESTLLPNPSGAIIDYSIVTAVSVTVTGASSGNGTFTRPDFSFWVWSTDSVVLDLTKELVGQPVDGGTWGTTGGCCGDFNLFRVTGSAAPTGTLQFRLTTLGGENMLLTSVKPSQSVPEPSSIVLLAMGSLGLFSGFVRRKLQA